MKNLIIQYYIDINLYSQPGFNGISASPVEKYSEYSFKKYCAKFGHDFLRVTKPTFGYKHPTWERFALWFNSEWLDKYDQILYVDTDVFALDHAPDIFALYSDLDAFKSPAYRKYRCSSNKSIEIMTANTILKDCDPDKVRRTFFQSGVWMLTKKSRDVMMPWVERYKEFSGTGPVNIGGLEVDCDDGQFLNWAVIESGVKYQDMNTYFNVKNNGLKKDWLYEKTYFLHVAGGKKYKAGSKIWPFLAKTFPEVKVNLDALIS